MPKWRELKSSLLETAARKEQALVIYFPAEGADDRAWADEELGKMSRDDAMFVWVEYNADREDSVFDDESAVPVSKLLSHNPSKAYNVSISKPTIIVADCFGNEYFRMTKLVKGSSLKGYISKVDKLAEKTEEKLTTNLDKARAKLDKKDRKGAIKEIMKNFKVGVTGIEAQEKTILMYHEIQDAAREQLEKLSNEGDVKGLKNLAKEMKTTDVEGEIKDAIKVLS